MIRCAPFWPMPGTVVSVLTSSVAHGAAQRLGPVHREHRLRELGSDAAGGLHELEHLLLVVVGEAEQRQRVLADDHAVGSVACGADAQPGEVSGVHWSSRPTPPTSSTARGRGRRRPPGR